MAHIKSVEKTTESADIVSEEAMREWEQDDRNVSILVTVGHAIYETKKTTRIPENYS